MDYRALLIYTDGSARPKNPGNGGIGVRIKFPDEFYREDIDIVRPGYKGATNNQMELKAAIIGLEEAAKIPEIIRGSINRIIVCSDSQYVVDNYPRAHYWARDKWKNRESGRPILNQDLWKEILKVSNRIKARIDFEKVKGHSKDKDNEAVNKIAISSANNANKVFSKGGRVRRKMTKEKTEIGSVKLRGQIIKIKVISTNYSASKSKECYVRYEVVSKSNEFYGKVDCVFSAFSVASGHIYLVKLNNDQNYPKIEKIIKEFLRK
jgi:ribonuclease HI